MPLFNIKRTVRRLLALLIALSALSGCAATGSGLHNSTKVFTSPSEMKRSDWSNAAELERTWLAARVRIPKPNGGYVSTTVKELNRGSRTIAGTWPAVIYLHGCTGVWSGTYTRINFLARNGYAVIAPVSFARQKYPKSCDPERHQGAFYRSTLLMRQNDAGYAIAKAKTLPWVDRDNVYLMGLSQGGITTATFFSARPEKSLRARIVEGWTCHDGWVEYKGINAPDNEPVLTLVGGRDPWFQDAWTKGDCTKFIEPSNGSRSVVYSSGYLSTRHELLESREVQATVLEFLEQHRSR